MTPPLGRIYNKNFNISGAKFTVQVSYQGRIPSGRLAQVKATWLYNLLVNNTVIEMGPWYDLQDRSPSNEEVCDAVAAFWYDSKKIRDAQDLADGNILDEIVEKCATWMHAYLISEDREHTDYDIVRKYMDEENWVVVLRPNYMPNRLVEFYKETEMDSVEIHSYIEDRELSVKL